MVWNTMLLSQYVIVRRGAGAWPLGQRDRDAIVHHYAVNHLPDGSWPMHRESGGYMFLTCLAYVSLRILGLPGDDPMVVRARRFLHQHDVLSVPTWGKFWLSILGLYERTGMNPVPPEIFLLPDASPIHPNQMYCHTRYTYMAIGYLYGSRFQIDLGPLGDELRQELYDRPYASIDFAKHRDHLTPGDVFEAPSAGLRLVFKVLHRYEEHRSSVLRERALAVCLRRIEYEQRASRFRGLSPVTGLLNCLVLFAANRSHPLLAPSLQAMETWRWEDAEQGLRLCGARSSAWDTAFAVRALAEAFLATSAGTEAVLQGGYQWLKRAQIREELPGGAPEARDPILGGFCFSAGDERWPVSDCTAEALSSLLAVHDGGPLAPRPDERLDDEAARQAVEFILQRQNRDGGFGSYERVRTPFSLSLGLLNPSEIYGDCMSERSYTECAASCVGALRRFCDSSVTADMALNQRIDRAIARAVNAISRRQLPDGSFAGSWGVNFTFGTFHAIEALCAGGVPRTDSRLARATAWLLSKQKPDGGWGEHWTSCVKGHYVEHPETQATMTAWALLGLLHVLPASHTAVQRAVEALERLQLADGSWPRQALAGVFFVTCLLDYPYYKYYFPTLALARYSRLAAACKPL